MRVWTNDPIVSPVTNAQLAEWLRLDSDDDPALPGVLISATQIVTDYLKLNLLQRLYSLVYSHWPIVGTPVAGLSGPEAAFTRTIPLPFAAYELVEVQAVTLYGEASDDYTITAGQPATLEFTDAAAVVLDPPTPAIVIEYITGYEHAAGTAGVGGTVMPEAIKQGVLMVAGYLFKNRGACNVMNAVVESGANALLYPFRQSPVVM